MEHCIIIFLTMVYKKAAPAQIPALLIRVNLSIHSPLVVCFPTVMPIPKPLTVLGFGTDNVYKVYGNEQLVYGTGRNANGIIMSDVMMSDC
jgi:hypothetical protein